MARRKREAAPAADGTALSNVNVQAALDGIDHVDDQLASLKGSYMADCKGPRGVIRDIKGDLREAGANMKAFNELLRNHREERKRVKRIAAMENDDVFAYEDMRKGLGEFADTPLGAVALDRARPAGMAPEAALDSLHA